MKSLLLALIMFTSTFSTSLIAREFSYAETVGIQSIIHQVVSKQLVNSGIVKSLLEGSMSTPGLVIRSQVENMECERALGTDWCSIEIHSQVKADQEGSSYSEQVINLIVKMRNGKVNSARIETTSSDK